VNEFQPIEPNSSEPNPSSTVPEPSIQQKAENSTVDGGMQSLIGDSNTQHQSNSSSNGNVVNVNVSLNSQTQETDRLSPHRPESHEPDLTRRRAILGCSFHVVILGATISISLLNIVFTKNSIPPDIINNSPPLPMPMPTMAPHEDTDSLLQSVDYLAGQCEVLVTVDDKE
jgi:hypothetical protein